MPDKITLKKYEIGQPLLLALMVVIGIILGKKIEQSSLPETKSKTKTSSGVKNYSLLLEEAARFIDARYIDSLNINTISELAIGSLVRELDPFSIYIPVDRPDVDTPVSIYDAFGISVRQIGPKWYIQAINPFFEIARTYLDVGDEITQVRDKTPTPLDFYHWSDSTFRLTVHKLENNADLKLSLYKKNNHVIRTVFPALPIVGTIGYIHIAHFGDNTYDEFISALDTLFNKHQSKHLIIDLRNNTGGYIEECSRILNQLFRDKNILLVSTQGRTVRKAEYKTDGRQLFNIEKIVILINEGSASASEVFAGSIQDLDRGIVIGRSSYGKGLVQEQYMLSNGGVLRLSVARFKLPSGRMIGHNHPENNGNFFLTVKGRKLPASYAITPDIQIAADTALGFESNAVNTQITDAVLMYKIQAVKNRLNARMILDPEKQIWNNLPRTIKQMDAPSTVKVKRLISKSLLLANKDFYNVQKSELLNQQEIQVAMKVLQ